MKLPRETDTDKKRLESFILESIRLDALLDARARDIEFIKAGGDVLYSPDHSTWSSFFFPVTNGQEHPGNRTRSIDGFAEVYLDSDRSEVPYIPDSLLTGKQVTGMLGKVLMDAIFAPQNENELAPDLFLTEESKEGLNEAIEYVLSVRNARSRDTRLQRQLAAAFQSLRNEFARNEVVSTENGGLFVRSPAILAKSGALKHLLDDQNPINLIERSKIYKDISFFDWKYIEEKVQEGVSDESTFYFGRSDLRRFERLREKFTKIFYSDIGNASEYGSDRKIASVAEILALNALMQDSDDAKVRLAYLTNSKWALRYFDNFVWDPASDSPLKSINESKMSTSVSALFVRSPLCFLHDIEMRPEDGKSRSALKVFMDSIVPRRLHDDRRLDTSQSKRRLIRRAVDDLEKNGEVELYLEELTKFYKGWSNKKTPWVNVFFAQRSHNWADGLELFSREGFHSFWRKVNHDFGRLSSQFGIYLALMTEGRPARAAPLVFIDCDTETNGMLSSMQSELSRGDIEKFRDQLEEFLIRPAERPSDARREYFDSLVNAVLFMFSSQFTTSKLHAETACDLAMKSTDPDVTGREAYYLRSHLVRVTAADRSELETARKLMLIARGKLELDNTILSEGERISTIRFDLEDWSRKIIAALADHFDDRNSREFPARHIREYLAFVRQSTNSNFGDLNAAEYHALYSQICERIRFNFLVLSVTMDEFNTPHHGASRGFLESIVGEWNRVFGSVHEDLKVCVTESMLQTASTIEQAYLIALAAGTPGAEFIQDDLDIGDWVSWLYDRKNRDAIKSAETSFIDGERYCRLRNYCKARLDRMRVQ